MHSWLFYRSPIWSNKEFIFLLKKKKKIHTTTTYIKQSFKETNISFAVCSWNHIMFLEIILYRENNTLSLFNGNRPFSLDLSNNKDKVLLRKFSKYTVIEVTNFSSHLISYRKKKNYPLFINTSINIQRVKLNTLYISLMDIIII